MTSTGGDLRGAERPLEQPAGSGRVAPWGDEHVDDLAELVDRPVDVAPAVGDPHIRLVDLPAITDGMSAGLAASASSGVNRCTHR